MRFLALLLLLAAVACGGSLLGPGEQRDLEAAESRWHAAALSSYAFDYRRSCFCLDAGRQVRITVVDGEVAGVDAIDGLGELGNSNDDAWPTVADLFTRLGGYATDDGHDGWTLGVTYDDALGYPTEIDLTAPENVADGGLVERLSNLSAT